MRKWRLIVRQSRQGTQTQTKTKRLERDRGGGLRGKTYYWAYV